MTYFCELEAGRNGKCDHFSCESRFPQIKNAIKKRCCFKYPAPSLVNTEFYIAVNCLAVFDQQLKG